MKGNIIRIIVALLILFCIMFAEYRFIMHNLQPYEGDNSTLYIEMFGIVDEYFLNPVSEMN